MQPKGAIALLTVPQKLADANMLRHMLQCLQWCWRGSFRYIVILPQAMILLFLVVLSLCFSSATMDLMLGCTLSK